ncbi:MAG: DUF6252 family protein [Gemmatimonadales bacterium]
MRFVALTSVVLLVACGGSNGPTNPGGGNPGVDNFTARVNGADWNAEFAPSAVNSLPGTYSITAFRASGSNNYTMIFSLWNIPGPGTYPLGVNLQMFGGAVVMSQPPSSGWTTPFTGNAGEIVITTLSATQIAGTFEFTAGPQSGTSGTLTVTEGEFDIPVNAGGAGLAPANKGASFFGQLGGTPIYGSQAQQLLISGNLTIVVQDDTRTITIGIANMTGTGSYPLSASAPVRTIQVGTATGTAWSSSLTGGNGSVDLTVTADRIFGTFNATVIGAIGATGPMTISGTFNIGRG